MIISGKRKLKLDKRFRRFGEGSLVIAGLPISNNQKNTLLEIGFTTSLEDGERVLPSSEFGPVSRYNAEGKEIIHKDQPMETAYRQVEWTWEQWAGRYDTETMSKIVDVPYKRYPRTFVPPPSIELSIVTNKKGEKFLVAPKMAIDFNNPENLLHCINIFLEIFNYCQIMTGNLESYAIKNVKSLNWHILPPGKYPWKKLEGQLKPLIEKEKEQKQIVIKHRLELITGYDPEFVAVGKAGFAGYLIFGFPRKNLYVLESLYYGNATYIFEENWETLSKLTKAEILTGNFQKDRFIHRVKWDGHIRKLLR
ncbi:MAG: hypothetical protein K9L30_15830 [Desulfobacterales bacterium]|nr:hypothetical protein [Desulfobacterales bacterium]